MSDMVEHKLQGLSADALVPIRFRHPIAGDGLALAGGQLAVARGAVAYRADGFACWFELDGPGGVVVKESTDNLEALLHTLMWGPARARPDVGVGGIFEQRFGIAVAPWAQSYSVCFHWVHLGLFDCLTCQPLRHLHILAVAHSAVAKIRN